MSKKSFILSVAFLSLAGLVLAVPSAQAQGVCLCTGEVSIVVGGVSAAAAFDIDIPYYCERFEGVFSDNGFFEQSTCTFLNARAPEGYLNNETECTDVMTDSTETSMQKLGIPADALDYGSITVPATCRWEENPTSSGAEGGGAGVGAGSSPDGAPPTAFSVSGYCFCADGLSQATLETLKRNPINNGCQPAGSQAECNTICESQLYITPGDIHFFSNKPSDNGKQDCLDQKTKWDADLKKLKGDAATINTSKFKSAFIPDCLLADDLPKDSPCRDVGIFVILGINIANYLFGIIGALALLMFIYGGVLFIISEGNPERVKKGADAMLAAVIGLIVVFSAYLLVGFLSEAVGVNSQFQL